MDDAIIASLPSGEPVAIYLDERRVERELPENGRAAVFAAHLGLPELVWRGDVLVTGIDLGGVDVDVPPAIFAVAVRAGIMAGPATGK